MASSPITSWQKEGEKVEAATDFLFLGSKITADGDCSHEVRRWLLLGRKVMTNLDGVLKSKDITLPYSQGYGLSSSHVWESWTIKKSWAAKNWGFWTGAGEDLRVPWKARRSNQPILKEINPEYSLEGMMLKLQYFGHWCEQLTHWKWLWCWLRLKAGGEEGDRGWDGWMASLIQWT